MRDRSPRKALPRLRRIELFAVYHLAFELLGGAAYLSSQVRALLHKLSRHRTVALFSLRYFLVDTSGRTAPRLWW